MEMKDMGKVRSPTQKECTRHGKRLVLKREGSQMKGGIKCTTRS